MLGRNEGVAIVQECAAQKLRATIISDGHLSRCSGGDSCLYLTLSDNKRSLVQRELIPVGNLLTFLQRFVGEVLRPLGVEPRDGYPRVIPDITRSKTGAGLPGVSLITHPDELLSRLRREYYPSGIKLIPESFVLTDMALAWLFMFDGNSQWDAGGGPGVDVSLYTQSYDIHSIGLLESQLHNLSISTGRKHDKRVKDGSGIIITITRGSTDQFMAVVDSYVISPYRYKVKYRGSCLPELSNRYRVRYNGYLREYRSKRRRASSECIASHSPRVGGLDYLRVKLEGGLT